MFFIQAIILIKRLITMTPILIAALMIYMSLAVSCISLDHHIKHTYRDYSKPPANAFAFIMVQKIATPGDCTPDDPEDSDSIELCEQVTQDLPNIVQSGTGSGLLVWANGKPIILTAAHVCLSTFPAEHRQDGITIKVIQSSVVSVRSHDGRIVESDIIAVDIKEDLCALKVVHLFSAPVKLAKSPPEKGDRVYAISAPWGINSPEMTLIFEGYYSGKDEHTHFYTIPTRPGSSGSVVLNDKFQAVGMLNAAFVDIESVGIGPGHEALKAFVESIN